MLGLGLWSLYLRWKGTLFTNRLVPACRHGDDAVGIRRRPVRLVHCGDRPPALCGLWTAADRGRRIAHHRRRGHRLAHRLHRRLRLRLRLRVAIILPSCCARGPSRSRIRAGDDRRQEDRSGRSRCPTKGSKAPRGAGRSRCSNRIRRAAMFGFGTEYEGLAFWLPRHLGGAPRGCGRHVCHRRRLRPRRRHPLQGRRSRELARPHDVLRRADLGRQRDVADPRRRRALRRLPPRLRDPACRRSTCRSSRC